MKIIIYLLAIITLISIIVTNVFDINLPYKLDHWINILLAIFVIVLGVYDNKKSNVNK